MKKLLITILTLISIPLYSSDNKIYIYQYNKPIGKFTVEQFELLVKGAEQYKEIMSAQKEDRVSIQVLSDLEKTSIINQYKAVIKIQWLNEKNEEVNFVSSIMFLNIDNESETQIPEWRMIYRNISEIGFPTSTIILVLFLLIVL
jgi:hypothetical protein